MNANANTTPTIVDLATELLALQAAHKGAIEGEAAARQNLHGAVLVLLGAVADMEPAAPAPATSPAAALPTVAGVPTAAASPEVFPPRGARVHPHE